MVLGKPFKLLQVKPRALSMRRKTRELPASLVNVRHVVARFKSYNLFARLKRPKKKFENTGSFLADAQKPSFHLSPMKRQI